MKLFKEYLKNNIITNILMIISSIILVVMTKKQTEIIADTFNSLIEHKNLSIFSKNIPIMLILLSCIFFFSFYSNYLRSKCYWEGKQNITMFFLETVFRKKFSYFIENKGPAISNDVDLISVKISDFYSSMFRLVSRVIESIAFTWVVFKMNIYGAIVCVLLIPLVVFFQFIIKGKMTRVIDSMMKEGRETSVITNETLESANNVKVKNEQDYFIKRITEKYAIIHNLSIKNIFYVRFFEILINTIVYIVPAIVLLITLNYNNSTVRIGEIIALFTITPLILNAYNGVIGMSFKYTECKPYLKRANKILEYEEEVSSGTDIDKFKELKTSNVRIEYENDQIVSIPDMCIKQGEKIIISGESGVGKSTLFDIILGFKTSYEGKVTINGVDLRDINIHSVRKLFGISIQNNDVFTTSLEDNIILGYMNDSNFESVVDVSGLKELVEDKRSETITVNTTSGGEKSRIGLAQNLIREPKVILLDETFSNIDEDNEKEILNKLINEFENKTIVCISHRDSTRKFFQREICF